MKRTTVLKFAVAAAALALAAAPTYAQRAGGIPQARDNAYLLAGQYSARGFYIQPAKSDICGAGATLEFRFSVNRAVDYVFLLAGDQNVLDIDVQVYSELGERIVSDTRIRPGRFAGVQWTSQYNGTVRVFVTVARANGLSAWCALVGRRGLPEDKEGEPPPPGEGPVGPIAPSTGD